MKSSNEFRHPLDPLSGQELKDLVQHARNVWKLDHRHLFAMVQLHEPNKDVVNNWKNTFQAITNLTCLKN